MARTKILTFALLSLLFGAPPLSADSQSTQYHLVQQLPLSGSGSWDYVACDVNARRLYVAHDDKVHIVDIDTMTAVGTIPAMGAHGVAVAPTLGRGFITNGGAGTVTVFKLATGQPIQTVQAGRNPDAVVFDPASQRVFAFNGRSQSATIFQAWSGKVEETLALNGRPEFAVADGAGIVFVNLIDKNELVRLDARALTIERRWSTTPCEKPSSLAIDTAHRRLFVGCRNQKMSVLDADNGTVIATLPIGDQVDGTVFDPETALIFNANGDGTITEIHEDDPNHYSIVETISTQPGARTIALDPQRHRLFLPVGRSTQKANPKTGIKASGDFQLLVIGR